jgi:hypothetical protein
MSKPGPTIAQLPAGYGVATNTAPPQLQNLSPSAVVPIEDDQLYTQGNIQADMNRFQERQGIWKQSFIEDAMCAKIKVLVCALVIFFSIFVLYLVTKMGKEARANDGE